MVRPRIIRSDDLKSMDLPPGDADWSQITLFALSFDVESELGKKRISIPRSDSFTELSTQELRALLFNQQRWWNNRSGEIDDDGIKYMQDIIDELRRRLIAKERN